MKLVKMKFTSPLHLAKGGTDYSESLERLHSDTLKSAIFSAARLFYEKDILAGQTETANPFLDAFTISSAFPFFQNELFFPCPMLGIEVDETSVKSKVRKKISYLGQSIFEEWANGKLISIRDNQLFQGNRYASDKDFPEGKELVMIAEENYQHVTVPRAGNADSDPFFMERLRFTDDAGLFFLIDIHDDALFPIIKAAIEILGDEGIGSDRSTGNGQFKPVWEDFSWKKQVKNGSHLLNLSLFCPTKDDFSDGDLIHSGNGEHSGSAYQLVRRGGYVASPNNYTYATLRKKPVYFFKEGSIFPVGQKILEGRLLNVRPKLMEKEHPVWREGRSMFISVHPPIQFEK